METQDTIPTAPLPRRRNRKRMLVSIALGMILLLSGIVIGSGATAYFLSSRVLEGIRNPDYIPEIATQRMRFKLGLNDEQTQKIQAIFELRKNELYELRARMQPRMQEEIEKLHQEVAAILTPEQAKIWDSRIEFLKKTLLPPPQPQPK